MKQILIVEDEIIMNKILSNILLAEGYGVTSAHTAEKARRCFRSTVNDLAILDISLPNGSDYEICKSIQENAQIAAIFLTANDMEQDMIKGYESGAVVYKNLQISHSHRYNHEISAIPIRSLPLSLTTI